MYFLHTDAEKCSDSICDQDVEATLEQCLFNLECVHKNVEIVENASGKTLLDWLEEDGFNYHWLAYFCERLQYRVEGSRYYSEIVSLRRNVPTRLRCRQMTNFPTAQLGNITHNEAIVAGHRADYFQNRWRFAEWNKIGVPLWFIKTAHLLLSPDDFKSMLIRPGFQVINSIEKVEMRSIQSIKENPEATIEGMLDGKEIKFKLWEG